MGKHERLLHNIYPKERFNALLPVGDVRFSIDLSEYGFECLGLIGVGLMADVFRVRDDRGREYACKVTSLRDINDGAPPAYDIAKRTLQEIRLSRKMKQDGVLGIMPLIRFYPDERKIKEYILKAKFIPKALIPQSWMILELMPLGVAYHSFIEYLVKNNRKLSEAEFAALLLDLLKPVQHMHSRSSVIHRDLKPQNIMLLRRGKGEIRAAITDFNVSKLFLGQVDNDFTKVGSVSYAHPRIVESPVKKVSRIDAEKADIYAVGMIGYQLLNAGKVAPCRGHIPDPKYSPSPRVSKLLRSILNEDLEAIPDCKAVINTLRSMVEADSAPRKSYNLSAPVQRKTAKRGNQLDHCSMFDRDISMSEFFDEPFFFKFPNGKF